ncbi:cation-translocating P-type ATPase [Lachnospiraceae bacterium 42-17]
MLTKEQVRQNQEKYGFNELAEGKKKGIPQIFLEQFRDFLVIILITAAAVSGFLGDWESAAVILIVIIINAALGTVQTVKAEQSLSSLKKLSAPEAKVVRDGQLIKIPAREVTIGDEVVIEAGDYIPADGKLLSLASLKVDESALTGESLPVEKSMKEVPKEAALGDQWNRVFSGSFATYGRGTFEVTEIGMNTEVGKIAGLLKNTSEKKTPLQISLDEFGRRLSIIILIFCGILFGINVFRGNGIADAFLFAVALAVAAIPEALSSIVTIVLSFGTQKMAEEHAIIRKLQAVEGLGSVSVICSDKTGTLTQNRMTVEDYYIDEKRICASDICLGEGNQKQLLYYSMLCNDAANTDGKEIGDPTEAALINLGRSLGEEAADVRVKYPRIWEIPFDSERKLMSTEHIFEGNYVMVVKGAVDVLLRRVSYIRIGDSVREIGREDTKKIERQNMEFSEGGLRVLAFAYKEFKAEKELELSDEEGLVFLGLISMMDPPREEAATAVRDCIRAGIRPIMITGDHKVTAAAIAKRIGILKESHEACEGAVIENMTEEELKEFVPKISVYARVSPEHKIRIVRAWQDRGNIVAMTGDGVNDAPALKQADIGAAMGITGSEVSKDAAAMVLTDDNFATIIKAVENGRNIYENIKNSIQFLLSGNFGAILAVLYASVTGLPVPFAPVHLLFINLLTDSLPAIALGLEPHRKEVMERKPRPVTESILTKNFLLSIGIEGLSIAAVTMTAFLIGYRNGSGALASTMAFGTLCISRLMHGFNCKTCKPEVFTRKIFNNMYLIGAFVIGLVLITCVLTVPAAEGVFKVEALNMRQLFTVYGLAFLNMPVVQAMKWIGSR